MPLRLIGIPHSNVINGAVTFNAVAMAALIEDVIRDQADNFHWHDVPLLGFSAETLAGTGVSSILGRKVDVATGGTATATARRATAFLQPGWSVGKNIDVLNWSKRIIFIVRLGMEGSTSNGMFSALLGAASADDLHDLDDKGIGFIVDALAIQGQVHDGTNPDEQNLATNMVDDECTVLVAVSDGAGTVTFYVNGTLKGTSTGGPTGDSPSTHTDIAFRVLNGADNASQQARINNVVIGVEQ